MIPFKGGTLMDPFKGALRIPCQRSPYGSLKGALRYPLKEPLWIPLKEPLGCHFKGALRISLKKSR